MFDLGWMLLLAGGLIGGALAGAAASIYWMRTRLRRARADVRQTQDMLIEAELFSGFGCWEHDVRTRETIWSPGVYALYKRDPALGPPTFNENMGMHTPESERTLREAIDEAIQTSKHFAVEIEARRDDGGLSHHFSMGRADRDEHGVVRRIFGTVYDITERKRFADEAKLAKEAAEKVSASKSAFIAHLAHEVRTPLTSVLGYARLIREGRQSPDERTEAASSILRAGEHMLRLINDILDQSKIEAGRMTIEEVACSPAELVSSVLTMMRPLATAKGVVLQSHLADDVPDFLMMDPTRMRQVLFNLVANAVRFTDTGSVSVEVEARRDEHEGVTGLRMRVRDSGIGMSPEQINKLFRPFVQVAGDAGRSFGGTGLGLSIAKNLVELMGGSISVSSKLGHGSVFTLEIACKAAGAPAPRRPMPPPRIGKNDDRWQLAGVRILLVDDSPDIVRLVETVLKRAGATVQTAMHGQAAVNAVLHRDAQTPMPDLVLMDVDMPVMSGPEAAKRLREIGYTRPILALTALDMTGRVEEFIRAGYDSHLPKPIAPEALVAACVQWAVPPSVDEDAEAPARAQAA